MRLKYTSGGEPYFETLRTTVIPKQLKNKMAPTKTGGDDLDDGFELDHDLIAQSDPEEEGSIVGENYEDFLSDNEDNGPTVSGKKRKAGIDLPDANQKNDLDGSVDKKKRKKEKEKERKAKVCSHLFPFETWD